MKKSKRNISFGPFFTSARDTQSLSDKIEPINLAVEWSDCRTSTRIRLYRRIMSHAPGRIRFENVVFHSRDLYCDMEYDESQSIDSVQGLFLPLGALLATLYRNRNISRPIFHTLDEFASIVHYIAR